MNLIVICADTLRWDYLGCYGNDWIKTPRLDALAEESAIYLDAFAEGLPTIPVRRVLATGRRIFPFRYYRQKDDIVQACGWHPLFDEDVTLSETLRDHGYVTCFATDVYHLMKPGKNFQRGFCCWYWVRGQEADPYHIRDLRAVQGYLEKAGHPAPQLKPDSWLVQHLMGRISWKGEEDSNVARVMRRAADWVTEYTRRKMGSPFFLYVDCFDPHEPWDPPDTYGKIYQEDFTWPAAVRSPGTREGLSEEQFMTIKAAYAGEVTLVDRWVGHLLDTVCELGLIDDTLVIFTSDHGTMMGEQGEIHKGGDRLRNQVTQVPLIIRHPTGAGAGARVSGFVQHQDIMPTALSLLGVPVPERVQGEDIWPMAVDGKPSTREIIISAFHHHASVRTREWNYLCPWVAEPFHPRQGRMRPRRELYDVKNDPAELDNVIEEHENRAKELDDYLREYVAEHAEDTKGTFGPGQAPPIEDQSRV